MTEQQTEILSDTKTTAEATLTAWRKTELARHAQRPYPMDFIEHIFTDFSEIHGDRAFGDDAAMYCAMARFAGDEVMVIANRKGRDMKERVHRNFGMPNPEGYRKALRAMKIAEKFNRPIFTLIDLVGAAAGIGAEERGQGEAIARNLREMSRLRVPTIATITGEGGSGGALALALADRVVMLENSVYSVISPEACGSIMWRDSSKRAEAAEALKITAEDVKQLGCVDDIVPEPDGGAHADPAKAAEILAEKLRWHLNELKAISIDAVIKQRQEKFRNIAQFFVAG
jgi:acetyl-CoA carboxylase carboxyl transferase subunit alpha